MAVKVDVLEVGLSGCEGRCFGGWIEKLKAHVQSFDDRIILTSNHEGIALFFKETQLI